MDALLIGAQEERAAGVSRYTFQYITVKNMGLSYLVSPAEMRGFEAL